MAQLSDRELAQIARETADILRDWFAQAEARSSDEALALIIIALEQRGFLFGEAADPPARGSGEGGNVLPFPRNRQLSRENRRGA